LRILSVLCGAINDAIAPQRSQRRRKGRKEQLIVAIAYSARFLTFIANIT